MNNIKISACLVIRNEDKLIQRCLESIKVIADEIIVVHDGNCQDNSLEIAKGFKAKIFVRDFIGEAEYHRPFSYQKAQGNWILQIDADEFLGKNVKDKIEEMTSSDKVDAYSFLWPYPDETGYIKKGPFAKTFKPVLFRKKKMYMIGISHEYPRTYGKLQKNPELTLFHRPDYDNYTVKAFSQKWLIWAKIQAGQIFNIKDAPTYNIKHKNQVREYKYYENMRKNPLYFVLKEMYRFTLIYLARGIILSGLRSFKIAVYELAYIGMVGINLYILKHGKRI